MTTGQFFAAAGLVALGLALASRIGARGRPAAAVTLVSLAHPPDPALLRAVADAAMRGPRLGDC